MAGARTPKPKAVRPERSKPDRPKGVRRTTPAPETLAELGPERLIGLILDETARNPAFKKLVTAALAARQGPEAVAAMVDRRLAALEGARSYIDWQKRRSFAADLDATVSVILNELRPLDPEAALDRIVRFLGGSDGVLNRVDDGSGRTYQLRDGSNIVGRGQDAQFRLPDTGVSRRHLEIRWDGQVALLSDLNSTNGTTVNNAPVQEWQLADGDVIRLGHSEIIVRIH